MIYVTYFPRYHVWTKGHAPTNFAKWRTATTPYKVCDPVMKYQKSLLIYDILDKACKRCLQCVRVGWRK